MLGAGAEAMSMRGEQSPLLTISPPDDEAFRMWATVLARSSTSAEELQAALRRRDYPNVVVRDRVLTAESRATWYVYRDGRWAPPGSTTVAIDGEPAPGTDLTQRLHDSHARSLATLHRTADTLRRVIADNERLAAHPTHRDSAERRIIEGEQELAQTEAVIARLDEAARGAAHEPRSG